MEQDKKTTAKAQALEMSALANYQEGSIVSRTIMDKKTGTVTFFPSTQDKSSVNTRSPMMLVHILDGEAEIVDRSILA